MVSRDDRSQFGMHGHTDVLFYKRKLRAVLAIFVINGDFADTKTLYLSFT